MYTDDRTSPISCQEALAICLRPASLESGAARREEAHRHVDACPRCHERIARLADTFQDALSLALVRVELDELFPAMPADQDLVGAGADQEMPSRGVIWRDPVIGWRESRPAFANQVVLVGWRAVPGDVDARRWRRGPAAVLCRVDAGGWLDVPLGQTDSWAIAARLQLSADQGHLKLDRVVPVDQVRVSDPAQRKALVSALLCAPSDVGLAALQALACRLGRGVETRLDQLAAPAPPLRPAPVRTRVLRTRGQKGGAKLSPLAEWILAQIANLDRIDECWRAGAVPALAAGSWPATRGAALGTADDKTGAERTRLFEFDLHDEKRGAVRLSGRYVEQPAQDLARVEARLTRPDFPADTPLANRVIVLVDPVTETPLRAGRTDSAGHITFQALPLVTGVPFAVALFPDDAASGRDLESVDFPTS